MDYAKALNLSGKWYNWDMIEPVIAIIFDFDETLGPDTISFFLKEQGVNVEKFWQEVKEMIKDELDPPFAYSIKCLTFQNKESLIFQNRCWQN